MFTTKESKYTGALVAVATFVLIVGIAVTLWATKPAPADQEWVTYTNDTYGYQIAATEGYGRVLEENLLVIEADVPEGADLDLGGESRAFYYNGLEFENLLGYISCYDTYLPWEELSNEMTLKEYAKTLYEIEMSIDMSPNYGQTLPISNFQAVSLGGKNAYSYVYGLERAGVIDIRSNVITENAEGNKCVISYFVTDHINGFNPEMLERRLHWFNSFTWIR